jgi:NADH:ubiquinone oxidoreductase subunit E
MDGTEFERALNALPRQRAELLPALLLAQRLFGFVPDEAIERIASHLRLTVNEVEGVATAYPDLARGPSAPHTLRICTGASCLATGARSLLDAVQSAGWPHDALRVEETDCCFICALAPAIELDGECLGWMTPERLARIVQAWGAMPNAPVVNAGEERR